MKTLSSLLILTLSMLFVVPKMTTISVDYQEPEPLEMYNSKDLAIVKKQQDIELIKSEIGVILYEIKLKMHK